MWELTSSMQNPRDEDFAKRVNLPDQGKGQGICSSSFHFWASEQKMLTRLTMSRWRAAKQWLVLTGWENVIFLNSDHQWALQRVALRPSLWSILRSWTSSWSCLFLDAPIQVDSNVRQMGDPACPTDCKLSSHTSWIGGSWKRNSISGNSHIW